MSGSRVLGQDFSSDGQFASMKEHISNQIESYAKKQERQFLFLNQETKDLEQQILALQNAGEK